MNEYRVSVNASLSFDVLAEDAEGAEERALEIARLHIDGLDVPEPEDREMRVYPLDTTPIEDIEVNLLREDADEDENV